MMPEVKKLINVLTSLNDEEWRLWVYIDPRSPISGDTDCVVLNPMEFDVSDDGFTPKIVSELGFESYLDVGSLLEVRNNLKQQVPDYSELDLLWAVVYFHQHDAFLEVEW